ncbi:MAG: Tyrosine--tRNA ligase [Microgenomates group bacterium ADurb.Bin219]|nr:MAG: Tyrosine--tRNA ligase [Microgenomates group bacterium ADurb.Bin219]HNP89442.1 tyrosine--tRNA ligase [Candidatus Woesebacteria bacterium]
MDKIEELLTRGVEKIYPSPEALEKILRSGKKIKLYQGFDPTAPSLHLGHYVGLLKLRQFQELGHQVIFLIGDFTGMIGDPSGKSETRKPLTREQVLSNSRDYKKQAERILNFSGENPAKLAKNSEWLDSLSFANLIKLSSNLTFQQVKERDMFQKRIREGKDIYLNEFLYPLVQGYDSLYMDVDLEVGGSDQLFNMMTGRDLIHKLKGKEKFVMTTKLLVDAKGEKVGKTTGNALFLNRPAEEFFGGIMSFPDDVLPLGFEILTRVPMEEVKSMDFKAKPMELKKRLAFEVVKIIYGEESADKALGQFEKVFQKKESPENLPQIKIESGEIEADKLLFNSGLVKSLSEAKRFLSQKAIEINGKIITNEKLSLKENDIIRIGKTKFVKIAISK